MKLPRRFISLPVLLAFIPSVVLADDVLETHGFTTCLDDPTIQVKKMNIEFDRDTNTVNFDVAGVSTEIQNVTGSIQISAYGKTAFSKDFNPCGSEIHVDQLCPVPKGAFAAAGQWKVPQQYAKMIPSIAYDIPDLDGAGKVELQKVNGPKVACIESSIGNSKTTDVPGVKYAAAAIAAGALIVTGISSVAGGGGHGHGGTGVSSPTFIETMHWFQSMAFNSMLSVPYPGVYRDFAKNFAFSTGIIPWDSVNMRIDNFRAATGGNLTEDSVQYLKNATLVFQAPNSNNLMKRSLSSIAQNTILYARDGISTEVNGTSSSAGGEAAPDDAQNNNKVVHYVQGIQGYVEQFTVPNGNTFMLVLLIFSIVLAAVIAGILLFKVILEAWSLFGNFPKKLVGFRKNYWWTLAKTITNLIFLLYSVWVLYCVYQFKIGDSWAAKVLAGITLALFTAVLLGFTWKIWHKAHQYKKAMGDNSILYDDKDTWRKYSLFYESYKRSYWWLFVPGIVYMFARGFVIAVGDGHGLAQTAAQLIIDSCFLILLLFLRPYNLKSGNWINIIIQVVRVISVICILVFVEELGVSQTTKSITGWVLVIVQGLLTVTLGILICVNALIGCCNMNPHRRQRKEAAQLGKRDRDDLTPLDAHNSLLLSSYPNDSKHPFLQSQSEMSTSTLHNRGRSQNGYDMLPLREDGSDNLVHRGAAMGGYGGRARSISPESIYYGRKQPQLPDLEYTGRAI
ncbi:MAG: hypothetical protein M1828_003037 [Chrysothrix sp. TS-e1954]|nr:MAG: hypothetical protein M1828_003037 [Chrysothrix sp. TS-e1954]